LFCVFFITNTDTQDTGGEHATRQTGNALIHLFFCVFVSVNTDTQDTGGEVEHATRQTGNAQEKPWFVIIQKKRNKKINTQLESWKRSRKALVC
jgi:hypothetical protein